jgi:hypothetical protein
MRLAMAWTEWRLAGLKLLVFPKVELAATLRPLE